MENFFKGMIICNDCKHVWVIGSNRLLTQEEKFIWIKSYIEQHKQIIEKDGKGDNHEDFG